MAAGDFDVSVRFRSALPGAGFSSTGAANANKTMVSGTIDFTYLTGGLVVGPNDLGLDTIDMLTFGQVQANGDTAPAAGAPFSATYTAAAGGSGKILINTNATTQVEAGQTAGTLSFIAFGDSALAPELT